MSVTAAQALDLLDSLGAAEVHAIVDGGRGVDALLGEQTGVHDDLDLVVSVDRAPAAVRLLRGAGFETERDLLRTALALRHPDGRAVDLHPVEPAADGGGDQVLEDGQRWHCGPPVTGTIGGREIACCSVDTQVRSHLGYEPDADDLADLAALAARFALRLPHPSE